MVFTFYIPDSHGTIKIFTYWNEISRYLLSTGLLREGANQSGLFHPFSQIGCFDANSTCSISQKANDGCLTSASGVEHQNCADRCSMTAWHWPMAFNHWSPSLSVPESFNWKVWDLYQRWNNFWRNADLVTFSRPWHNLKTWIKFPVLAQYVILCVPAGFQMCVVLSLWMYAYTRVFMNMIIAWVEQLDGQMSSINTCVVNMCNGRIKGFLSYFSFFSSSFPRTVLLLHISAVVKHIRMQVPVCLCARITYITENTALCSYVSYF